MTQEARSTAINRFEVWGAVFIILTGSPLHFLYSETGWQAVAWLAPINESTWEHFKLLFWPSLIWAGVEHVRLKDFRRSLWTAKLASLAAGPTFIAGLFYAYTWLLGDNLLVVDISIFVVAVCVAQWISCSVWLRRVDWPLAVIAVVLMAVLFAWFSFSPSKGELFSDPAVVERTPNGG
jgi:glutathione S-transferase